MTHKFAFIKSWKCIIFDKLINYFKYIFEKRNIPFIVMETPSDLQMYIDSHPTERIIIIQTFSNINQYAFPVSNANYLHIVTDPKHNLEIALLPQKHAIERNVVAFVTLTMIEDAFFMEHWPTKPVFHFFQGYMPHEDILDENKCEKTVDVVAPGYEGFYGVSEDRSELVKRLRARGLTVDDKKAFGEDLDQAIRNAKVFINYPFDNRYIMWHGQRTLWAINKNICVITTSTQETKCEEFYGKGLYIQAPIDIDKFVGIVVNVIKSGRWKQTGYNIYKKEYDAIDLFKGPFYDFCQTLTTTQPVVK